MPLNASPSGTFTIRYAQKVFHVDRRYGLRRILKPKAISEKIEAVEMDVRVGTISGCSQNTIQDMKTISDIGRSKVSRKYCASSNPSP